MLGIDPGLAATGFGVLEAGPAGLGVVDAGVIETSARLPMDDRLRLIYDGVWGLLDKHGPAALVLEGLYSEYRFPRTALLMAHARGVACLAASQRGVRVMTLAPAEVKRAITGNGAAAKEQIQRGIQRLLHLPALPQPSHVADALALALTGLSRVGRHHMGGGGAIDPIGGGQAPPPRPPLNDRLRRRSRRIDHIGEGEAPPPRPPLNNRPRRRSRRSNGQ